MTGRVYNLNFATTEWCPMVFCENLQVEAPKKARRNGKKRISQHCERNQSTCLATEHHRCVRSTAATPFLMKPPVQSKYKRHLQRARQVVTARLSTIGFT